MDLDIATIWAEIHHSEMLLYIPNCPKIKKYSLNGLVPSCKGKTNGSGIYIYIGLYRVDVYSYILTGNMYIIVCTISGHTVPAASMIG